MKAPKQTQKQQIARLENVYFQTWTMLKMVEKEIAIIQEHLARVNKCQIVEQTKEINEEYVNYLMRGNYYIIIYHLIVSK